MKTELKLKSITRKWMLNVMPFVVIFVVICEIVSAIALFNHYENLVIDTANEYVRDINVLSNADKSGFNKAARQYAQNFSYRDKVEVQIFDAEGNIIVTTNGFASPGIAKSATDYNEAISKGGRASWFGKNKNGEHVIATTTVLPDLGMGSNGAYRVLVSMDEVLKTFYTLMVILIAIGILILLFALWSGVYFISTIVKPVREVIVTARKIAGGDFDARLTVKNVDEIGELGDTINYMASELKNAEKVKNDFISSVSHELRTPLTAIKGWGETVKLSIGEDDEIVERGVDVMLGEAERLSGLVEELLDFSRLEAGVLTVTLSHNDPLEIIGSVVNTYEEIARKQKLNLSFVKPDKCDSIMADRDRIKQVFINIIDNAIKYTDAGGHIVVSVFNEEACIRVTISDTGCGIPVKDIAHVKEKFFKANNNVRGSGIGLAVADEIIRHHNGLLLFESIEGEGTTVTVVLPTVKSQPDEITEVIFPPDQKGN